ncbi:ricin-type beta-trefoil lectin domain protein [Streptomyces sp. NBC_00503]|uniref:ricin-type beta-trefoil lectin domain protein n=1 Tax=Streptomyces sp. NBC_00503 TaxID=2903659 RepID=UPI002E7FDF22|nr:ricin-type beta-trefoil lectin domain protein [Streptomyces sp. NBC_00503]WUD85375.1 ricin-type beta-trefoil lectin domain protein [Streptomyces sp. NBC_00503]
MLPLVGVAVLSLGAGLIAAPNAFAENGPANHGPANRNWPASTPKPKPTAEQKAMDAALAQAKTMGKRVVVDHLTTANSQTFANPGGTLTVDTASAPERVKQANGSWRAIDTTLKVNADGTISPAVVPSALSISGGGSGPMATMTTGDGKKLAFKAPFKLPKPTLDGNDALYKNVLPDVDLRLTATQLGGWSQVLIVRTAAAAANPALKKIRLDVDAPGLHTSADAAGNIAFNDVQGKARFTSPTSFMWDSAKTATPDTAAAPQNGAKAGKSAAVSGADAAPQAAPAPAAADAVAASTADAPGDTANVKPIAVKTDATGIDLTPDTSLLGQGTGPWYIDPGVNPTADSGNQAWSQVQEAYPDTNEFNGTSDGQNTPAAGYCGYSTCTVKGRTRAYFQIGINTAIHGAEVLDARLYATVVSSSSPSTATPMGLYHTGGISSPTSWNHQPCDKNSRMGGCTKIGGATISGTGEIQYDVTAQMKNAASGRWSTFTFGLAPDDEGNMYYRQRFNNTPHVVTTYDFQPFVGSPRTSPTPGFAGTGSYSACTTPGAAQPWDNPGWMGANTNVYLTSDTWSPTGRQLQTTFQMWDDDAAGASQWFATGWNGSSGDAVVDAGRLIEGHQYGWTARTTDGTLTSAETGWCFFRVDRTAPSASVTSTDFPASGTTGGHPKKVDEPGTFTLFGADNAPTTGTNRSSGLACARWTMDPVKAASDWNCTDTDPQIIKTFTGGQATVNYTPRAWGTNYLYLQTQDNAGNMSQPVAYSFYVPSNPNSPAPIFGDINGDKKADVVLADAAGNIRQINGGADPAASPVALARSSVSGNGWNNIQLTHRGSLGYKNVDDLLAHEPGKPNLYVFTNNNTGLVDGQAPNKVDKPASCAKTDGTPIVCADYGFGTDWSKATQIAAYGSITGDSKAGLPNSLPQTSLLWVENGRLWLGIPGATNQLDSPAYLISGNDTKWDSYELITPGRAKGTNFATLWARNKTDGGTLHAFTITGGTPDAPVLTPITDPAAGVISGKVDPARYPRVGSDGDLTGDNIPDLWAVDKEQQLVAFAGAGTAPNGTSILYPTVTGVASAFTLQGNLNTPTVQWKLNAVSGASTPSAGGNKYPGTVAGAVTFPTEVIDGRSTKYAAFGGAGSTITTTGPGIDTRKDFTITTWAKHGSTSPGPTTSMIVSQDGTQNSSFMIYGDKNSGQWHFAMANAQGGAWPYDFTSVANQSARWTADTWTRLTAVYNAGTGLMSLYVNGVLASTGHHTAATSPAPSGPIVFGRYKVSGANSDTLNGGVSNFAAYSYAAAPTAPAVTGRITLSAAPAPGICMDNDYALSNDGNKIQIAACNGTVAQDFDVRADGSLRIQDKCVNATNSGTANLTLLELRTCGGTPTPAQKFLPRADGSLYNPASGRCVDLGNYNTTPGTQLWLYDCNPSNAQRWSITTLGTAPLPIPTLDAAP